VNSSFAIWIPAGSYSTVRGRICSGIFLSLKIKKNAGRRARILSSIDFYARPGPLGGGALPELLGLDPGFAVPGLDPGFGVAGFVDPGVVELGFVVLGFVVPGFVAPGFGVPGFVDPGVVGVVFGEVVFGVPLGVSSGVVVGGCVVLFGAPGFVGFAPGVFGESGVLLGLVGFAPGVPGGGGVGLVGG
jgi:hypothetical protein